MDRDFLEDYEQKERSEYERLLRKINDENFSFENDKFPPDERFINIQKPVATFPSLWLATAKDIWAMIPFCGSLICYLPPVKEEEFERHRFKVSEIPKIIDFIQETGKLQVMFGTINFRAYEGLDYLNPFFEVLKPPVAWGIPIETFENKKAIKKAEHTFYTLAAVKYNDWLKNKYFTAGYSLHAFLAALIKKLDIYRVLKLGRYTIIEDIENLMIDDPEKAHRLLYICGVFITQPLFSLRTELRNIPLEGLKEAQDLPSFYCPELRFPCEIGKFLVKKLTYAPMGLDACKELMYHYDAYDLQKVQGSLNDAIVTNQPDIVNESTNELSSILDNIWSDKTIPRRVKGLQIGIPLLMAAIGNVAAGPIGTMGGFLAGLGYSVADKFIDLETEGLSERLAKLKSKSFQANVYDFKKKYKPIIAHP